jgi:hypothetical protein
MLPPEARARTFFGFPGRALRDESADILFSIAFSHHPDLAPDPLISQKYRQGENRSDAICGAQQRSATDHFVATQDYATNPISKPKRSDDSFFRKASKGKNSPATQIANCLMQALVVLVTALHDPDVRTASPSMACHQTGCAPGSAIVRMICKPERGSNSRSAGRSGENGAIDSPRD